MLQTMPSVMSHIRREEREKLGNSNNVNFDLPSHMESHVPLEVSRSSGPNPQDPTIHVFPHVLVIKETLVPY